MLFFNNQTKKLSPTTCAPTKKCWALYHAHFVIPLPYTAIDNNTILALGPFDCMVKVIGHVFGKESVAPTCDSSTFFN